jgi:hypothetical protein
MLLDQMTLLIDHRGGLLRFDYDATHTKLLPF